MCALVTKRARSHAASCAALHSLGMLSQSGDILKYTVVTNMSAARVVNVHVARFIFANNLPFTVVQDGVFESLVDYLRPGIRLPHPSTVANTLLDQVFDTERSEQCKSLAGQFVTLNADGWTNPQGIACVGLSLGSDL